MRRLMVALGIGLSFCAIRLPAEQIGPWDVHSLKSHVPAVDWLRQDQPIHSITYAGEMFRGQLTQVFAFYASPHTIREASSSAKFPGIVLVHGGGGTAFAEWVYLWAKRGYSAIAMDLSGSRPPDPVFDAASGVAQPNARSAESRSRLPKGGPNQTDREKFDTIGGDTSDDWPYHAVANVIRAHSLLRSFPEVDPERTAITGISWGGYTTCFAASLDDRFKAAVPVYGCGFLYEGESIQKPSIVQLEERMAAWVKMYDPSGVLRRCRVPILFINGTNDVHYPLDSYMKSFESVPGNKCLRIEVNMPHGHVAGWSPKEIELFIDSKCRGGVPLPILSKPLVTGDAVKVACDAVAPLKRAELHYTTETGPRSARKWITVPAEVNGTTVTAGVPPAEANTWFIAVTDERDAMVSTVVTNGKD